MLGTMTVMGNEAVTGQRGMIGMVMEGGDMEARNRAEAQLLEKAVRKGGQGLSNETENEMREFKDFLFIALLQQTVKSGNGYSFGVLLQFEKYEWHEAH